MSIDVRRLAEADVASADRIFRLAFGTFIGLQDPLAFRGDAELIRPRWRSQPDGAFGAYRNGELIGSSFAARWGSFGIFGPVSVRPDCWDTGAGKRLVEPALALFERWGVEQAGLFTFAQSPKHIGLYQRFGFWPQQLTIVMAKELAGAAGAQPYEIAADSSSCVEIAAENFPGLDPSREMRAVDEQQLGATVTTGEGFAVCHAGKGSEAGSGACFVKFAAVRPGASAPDRLKRLFDACAAFAAARGATRLIAGVNTARQRAYRLLLDLGFRGFFHGIAMQRPDRPGFNRPDRFVIDDWR